MNRSAHFVFAMLLWWAIAVAFVGHCFISYEQTTNYLQITRMRSALSDLRQKIQTDLDLGKNLPRIEADSLFRFLMNSDPLASGVFIFDKEDLLFSTDHLASKEQMLKPSECLSQQVFFSALTKNWHLVGTPITNALNEPIGCVVVQYAQDTTYRTEMIKVAVKTVLQLFFLGFFTIGFFYTNICFRLPVFEKYKKRVRLAFVLMCVMCVWASVFSLRSSFQEILHRYVTSKMQVVGNNIHSQMQKGLQYGIPLDQFAGVESYFETIRQNNLEIIFVLLTDKTGRVLYESGSAIDAFETDIVSNNVVLKKGYFTHAVGVVFAKSTIGWIQIGVKEDQLVDRRGRYEQIY